MSWVISLNSLASFEVIARLHGARIYRVEPVKDKKLRVFVLSNEPLSGEAVQTLNMYE